MRVLLPTFGGPTTAMTMGGGSRGVRSTTGIWCFFVFISNVLKRKQKIIDIKYFVLKEHYRVGKKKKNRLKITDLHKT